MQGCLLVCVKYSWDQTLYGVESLEIVLVGTTI